MRKGILGSLAALLLGAGLAHAQWGPPQGPPPYPPFPPPGFPPPGYPPPQFAPPYPPPGFPPYGSHPPAYPGNPYPMNPSAPSAPVETPPPPAETSGGGKAACANCNQPAVPPAGPELYDFQGHAEPGSCNRFWMSAEYLYWWVKAAPTNGPLVTTGSATDPIPGAIGQPGTSSLFGGNNVNFAGMSGFRLTLGGWCDSERKFGLEASGFILENQVNNFSNSSAAVLTVPVNITGSSFPNGQNAVPLNSPAATNPLTAGSVAGGAVPTTGPFTGNVSVSLASQLWGAEMNGYYNLFRGPGYPMRSYWAVDVLGGLRYLNLQESMTLNATSTDSLGSMSTYNDSFQASNQFWGGQIGLRASYSYCGFSIIGTLKAAFGVNNESLNVNGSTVQNAGGTTTTFAGGILTQPTNIGTQRETVFGFVPSANLKIGYDLSPNVQVFAGYDFLYWMNVARASNQTDAVNPSQAYGGTLAGAANPAPMFNHSNYFAQGVSLGIMFSY